VTTGRVDKRYAAGFPSVSVEARVGWCRWLWVGRAGVGGKVVESGVMWFRWRADRKAAEVYAAAIGLTRRL
jgi:hypothetical protein